MPVSRAGDPSPIIKRMRKEAKQLGIAVSPRDTYQSLLKKLKDHDEASKATKPSTTTHPTLHPDNMSKSGATHTHVSGPTPTVPASHSHYASSSVDSHSSSNNWVAWDDKHNKG